MPKVVIHTCACMIFTCACLIFTLLYCFPSNNPQMAYIVDVQDTHLLWLWSGPPVFIWFSISVISCCRVIIVVLSLYSFDFYVLGDVALMS